MANTDISIILAEVSHLDDVAPLFDLYRQFYKQASNVPAAQHFLFERTINKESVIYLAWDNAKQKAVGFTQLYPTFSSISMESSWVLNDLFVLPEYRQKGVGKQLIDAAKTLTRQREDKGLALSTAHDNQTAQRLYEALGFQKDNDFYQYFWNRD